MWPQQQYELSAAAPDQEREFLTTVNTVRVLHVFHWFYILFHSVTAC